MLTIKPLFMKKIMFASAAAFCAAMGLSSYRQITKTFTGYYYFKVNPTKGAQFSFRNVDVEFYGRYKPISNPCSDDFPPSYECLVGFTAGQVTHVLSNYLITAWRGPQPPMTVPFYRTYI
jgi:hypothetical protein